MGTQETDRRAGSAAQTSPQTSHQIVPDCLALPPPQTEPQHQAETLLREIQTHSEHTIGSYVPACNLARFYGDLAKERGWEPLSWHVIGRELGKLTERVSKRRGGKRFNCYRIPRPI